VASLAAELANVETLADFPASIGGSGWFKLPNGLIIQWGSLYCAPNTASQVFYPIAFPNAVLVPITTVTLGGTINYAFSAGVISQTASYMYINLSGAGTATTVFYIVIGY
jgi:hypothetical protein